MRSAIKTWKEAEMIHFYEKLMIECDYPDVNTFVRELLEEKAVLCYILIRS
jgi:hypothetical protein